MAKTIAFAPVPETATDVVAWTRLLTPDEGAETQFVCGAPRWGTQTEQAVRAALDDENADVITLQGTDAMGLAIQHARVNRADLLVTSVAALPLDVADTSAERFLHEASTAAFVVYAGTRVASEVRRVLAIVSGSAHDRRVVEHALGIAQSTGGTVTLAVIESDIGAGADELGRRELDGLLHEIGVSEADGLETKVVVDNHPVRGVFQCFDGHDLVLVGASEIGHVKPLREALDGAAIGIVKRAPPLRRRALPDWIPQINAADYAELIQNLRTGSRWRADFTMMLGLAAGIASLGLIQNSPAVVIGSMLLAPLMTPMLGMGLALVQANGPLARLSGRSIALGVLMTLLISLIIGFLSPRETLSPETLARGAPNIFDLGIALFAAIAAAYALARPALSGAIAGVAIATALVPPVCSIGISLAYGDYINAFGATVLFITNLLAIIAASALTFSVMGVTVPRTSTRNKRTARRGLGAVIVMLLLLCLPLSVWLADQVNEGRAQPLGFPVTRRVSRAVHAYVDKENGAKVMLMAHSSVEEAVVVYVAADHDLPRSFGEDIRKLVRDTMENPDLRVEILVVRSAWQD